MSDFGRLLALLLLGGGAITGLGAYCVWFLDEGRRVRKSLRKVLKAEPSAELVVKARGRGVAFDFGAGTIGVCWDAGGWCLSYRTDELLGAEVIVDGEVAGRVHRGEARRPLDRLCGAEESVALRLVFDDVSYPDFRVDLWLAGDDALRDRLTAAGALQEANHWLARIDTLVRRPTDLRAAAVVAPSAMHDDVTQALT